MDPIKLLMSPEWKSTLRQAEIGGSEISPLTGALRTHYRIHDRFVLVQFIVMRTFDPQSDSQERKLVTWGMLMIAAREDSSFRSLYSK